MSENVKIFIQDQTLRSIHTQLQARNAHLSELVHAYANDTWAKVQANVKAGKARALYRIGDEFVCNYTLGNTVYECPWVVVQNDYECEWADGTKHPGMILQMKYATIEEIQFDKDEVNEVDLNTEPTAIEGWTYFGVTGTAKTKLSLETGDTIPTTYDRVLKCWIPDVGVVNYGYNRWSHSAYRQWLNSDATAGNWWEIQHPGDCAPTQLESRAGFMAGLDADFLACVNPVKVQTACNTVTDGGATDITYDRFFLPSLEEIYAVPQIAGVEGDYWPYWKSITGLSEPSNAANDARKIPRLNNKTGAAVNLRLRSAHRGNSYNVWYVHTGGSLYYSHVANNSYSSCPACVIS